MNADFRSLFWPAFVIYGVAQLVAAFVGIGHGLGAGWAWVAIIVALAFRFTWPFGLPVTIGAFYGATHVWGWHWVLAALFVIPGMSLAVPVVLMLVLEHLSLKARS